MTFKCSNLKCKEIFPSIYKLQKCTECGCTELERVLPEVSMECDQCKKYTQELLNVNVIETVIVNSRRKRVILKQKVCFICLRKMDAQNLIKWKGTYWMELIHPYSYKNQKEGKRGVYKRNVN